MWINTSLHTCILYKLIHKLMPYIWSYLFCKCTQSGILSLIVLLYIHMLFLITAKTLASSIAFPNHFGWLNHTIIAPIILNLMFLLKCQNFNCIDIHVCKFTSCRHTYPVEPQRSYIQVSLQLRGDQIRGIINVHLIQQAPSCCMYDRVQHHACLP